MIWPEYKIVYVKLSNKKIKFIISDLNKKL